MCVCSIVSNSLWPHGCSPPGSSVHGISQARILEWVAISYARGFSRPRDQTRTGRRILDHWATREAPFEQWAIRKPLVVALQLAVWRRAWWPGCFLSIPIVIILPQKRHGGWKPTSTKAQLCIPTMHLVHNEAGLVLRQPSVVWYGTVTPRARGLPLFPLLGTGLLTWAGWPARAWAPWCPPSCRWSWCWCEGRWQTAARSSLSAARSACWCFRRGRAARWSCTISHWGCLSTLKKSEAGSGHPWWLPGGARAVADGQGSFYLFHCVDFGAQAFIVLHFFICQFPKHVYSPFESFRSSGPTT